MQTSLGNGNGNGNGWLGLGLGYRRADHIRLDLKGRCPLIPHHTRDGQTGVWLTPPLEPATLPS